MADIRINALPTTASTSSSDDYIALDGTTNGTRKLNAYNPTFGGNLTVNGTASAGTLTDGYITVSAAQINRGAGQPVELQYAGAGGVRMFGATATPITFSSAGNLTVSGTGLSSVADSFSIGAGSAQIFTGRIVGSGGTSFLALGTATGNLPAINGYTAGFAGTTNLGLQVYGGNLLVAKTSDDALGKLQVGGSITATEGTNVGLFGFFSGSSLIAGSLGAQSFILRTNNTAALTIDTSQNATIAGNLTVSGAGLSSITRGLKAQSVESVGTPASYNSTGGIIIAGYAGSSYAWVKAYSDASGTEKALTLQPASGAVLLGTTTNSGNGKLQLATHTTSAGGIGFGTDVSLYRVAAGALRVDNTGAGDAQISVARAGVVNSTWYVDGSNVYLDAQRPSMGFVFRTNGSTTALTLDSSQNATFAGTVTASKAGTAFYSIESTVNGAISEVIVKGKNSTGTAREARLGLNKYADDVFSIYDGTTERFRLGLTNGNATITGALAINNTVQTAASVASTHKVTIVIGGVTYYLLATNI